MIMKKINAGTVAKQAKGAVKDRKKRQKEQFSKRYDKLKQWQPKTMENMNMNEVRYLPKEITNQGLSKQALIVYPVLCCEADFVEDYEFQISRENLSRKSGLHFNGVKSGIDELVNKGWASQTLKTEGRRRFYVYKVHFIRKHRMREENYFSFHKAIIESGIWSKLMSRAKVLYLNMRAKAWFDLELYARLEYDCESWELKERMNVKSEDFRERSWDVLISVSLSQLCGETIQRSNISGAIYQLEDYGLIEVVDSYQPSYKVYLKPKELQLETMNMPIKTRNPIY
jgi:hypothetical protein